MGLSFRSDTKKWVVRIRNKSLNINYSKCFSSKVLAKKDEIRVLSEIESGTFQKQSNKTMKLKVAIDMYMQSNIEGYKKTSTVQGYQGYIDNHILPYFKEKTVNNISKFDCEQFVKFLMTKPCIRIIKSKSSIKRIKTNKHLSSETINHIICLLNAIFNYLVDSDIILKNPMLKVKKPPKSRKEAKYLTIEECNKLLSIAKTNFSPTYYRILLVSIITGMRQGEALALQWDDIDLKNGIISINKTYSKGKVGKPKTLSSIRNVKIPKHLVLELKEHKLYVGFNKQNLVFTNQQGNYIDARNLVNRFLKPCLKLANLKTIKWHELRHSCITALAENRVNIKSIQKQVGHSSELTTLKIYTHATAQSDTQMIRILDSAFVY